LLKKFLSLVMVALWAQLGPATGFAEEGDILSQHELVLEQYDKAILIDQHKQVGAAYEAGEKLFEFPVITGDDETTTSPGRYLVRAKDEDYYSKKYQTPMPYSLFFDLRDRKAIHEGEVPAPADKRELATHGCVNVEQPYMIWLYDWAEEGKTAVVVRGGRTED
jgi:lipoprotein-anchoring transpeptidase ErfK/SrfK